MTSVLTDDIEVGGSAMKARPTVAIRGSTTSESRRHCRQRGHSTLGHNRERLRSPDRWKKGLKPHVVLGCEGSGVRESEPHRLSKLKITSSQTGDQHEHPHRHI